MQKFAAVMLLGAASAHHHHHHAPASVNYFAEGNNEEEVNAMPVHTQSKQVAEAYLAGQADMPNEANVQVKYNEAGLWQYEQNLVQLNEDPVAAAEAKTAELTEAGGYDMKTEEYGATEKVQSLNPIAYEYWSDMNKTGAFRRARTTFF